jgi:hypothetical protein
MSDKKIIKINSSFFSNKNRTQKVKKEKINIPLINPNILKKNLINRIKAYKNKEGLKVKEDIKASIKKDEDIGVFSDEFNDSINYLDILSKKKKEEKKQQQVQQQQTNIERKTLKNYNIQTPFVQLELPEELREPFVFNTIEPPIFKLNIEKNDDVPFGCLKNGSKPTYRTWQMTKKNIQQQILPQTQTQTQTQTQIQPQIQYNDDYEFKPKETIKISEREKRLEVIKQKLKAQQLLFDKEKELERENDPEYILFNKLGEYGPPGIPKIPELLENLNETNEINGTNELASIVEDIKNEPKVMIKKTIKRRYTLGKSNIYKKVGILIKNDNTRKKIINAHKELKKKTINEVKKYLKDHGLIKVGSNAPNDVLRKIYESSMLTGDVINNNKEILLHNFLQDTQLNFSTINS